MPLRTIPGTSTQYYLICVDENGVERPENGGTMLSDSIRARLADTTAPVTDVFLCSHGWQGDVPGAIKQYDKWVGAMASADNAADAATHRPGFNPVVVGVHWPSLPYGDEVMPGQGGVLSADDGTDIEAQIEQFASSIADTPKARKAIRVILESSAEDNGEGEELPDHVRTAYEILTREAKLVIGENNPGGAPGEEQGDFDADAVYADARSEAIAEGSADGATSGPALLGPSDFIRGLWTKPLQLLSFFKMKDRARAIGEGEGHELLVGFQKAAPLITRFHLMGHSFGCIVMSGTVAGTPAGPPLVRPVDTLFLVQGALSLWSYSPNLPVAPGKVGYFNRILAEKLVRGPIITTQSLHDTCVKSLYPAAAGVKRQVVLGDDFPTYGGVGRFGIQGIGNLGVETTMESSTHDYGFKPGHVYNLESSNIIKAKESLAVGAHNDFAHPEVAHVFWQAVLCVA